MDKQEAIEAIAGLVSDHCEEGWWQCEDNDCSKCKAMVGSAEQIIALKWPDGSPMIAVLAKDQDTKITYSYGSLENAHEQLTAINSITAQMEQQGFRKVVIDGR